MDLWQKIDRFLFPAMFIFCLILLILSGVALAEPVTITWKNPTQRVDGTPLDPKLIMETRIWCDSTGWPPTKYAPGYDAETQTPAVESIELDLSIGVHSCYAKTALSEKDSTGKYLVSEASTANEFTVQEPPPVDPAKPNAPVEMKVTQILTQ